MSCIMLPQTIALPFEENNRTDLFTKAPSADGSVPLEVIISTLNHKHGCLPPEYTARNILHRGKTHLPRVDVNMYNGLMVSNTVRYILK